MAGEWISEGLQRLRVLCGEYEKFDGISICELSSAAEVQVFDS